MKQYLSTILNDVPLPSKKQPRSEATTKKQNLPPATSTPYTQEQLPKKHPTIIYSPPPSNQLMTSDYIEDSLENSKISTALLATPTELNIVDNSKNIVATLQNINFSGSNTYLKVSIKNSGSKDFLTGVMMVYWQKSDATTRELWASYITGFPIISTGEEVSFVYAFHSVNAMEDDKFIFEIKDRKGKMTLHIDLPGKIYNDKMAQLESDKSSHKKKKAKKKA